MNISVYFTQYSYSAHWGCGPPPSRTACSVSCCSPSTSHSSRSCSCQSLPRIFKWIWIVMHTATVPVMCSSDVWSSVSPSMTLSYSMMSSMYHLNITLGGLDWALHEMFTVSPSLMSAGSWIFSFWKLYVLYFSLFINLRNYFPHFYHGYRL